MTIYRFDQIAENLTVRVQPADTDLERYVGLEHLDPESLKLRRWGSPADVIGQKLRFWKGDIIYGKRRAYQRKLAIADFDGICSAHAMVLRAKQDVILPELLPFFLQSEIFHQRAMEISVGSLSPTINWSALAKQEFPLPPVDEQRRIADLLWAADDAIQELQTLADASQKLLKSIQENSLLDNNPESEPFRERLDTLFEINPSEPPLSADSPFIAMEAVDEWTREVTRYDEKGTRGGVRARAGDVLLARITPSLENGKTSIVPNSIPRCGGSTEFIVIRGKKGVSSDLAYWIATSHSVRKIAIGLMHGSTGRQRVSANDFASIKIKLSDTQNTNDVIQLLNNTYESYQNISVHIQQTRDLKKKLLDKYLK
jgi:type I restriction enzyme S subunit